MTKNEFACLERALVACWKTQNFQRMWEITNIVISDFEWSEKKVTWLKMVRILFGDNFVTISSYNEQPK